MNRVGYSEATEDRVILVPLISVPSHNFWSLNNVLSTVWNPHQDKLLNVRVWKYSGETPTVADIILWLLGKMLKNTPQTILSTSSWLTPAACQHSRSENGNHLRVIKLKTTNESECPDRDNPSWTSPQNSIRWFRDISVSPTKRSTSPPGEKWVSAVNDCIFLASGSAECVRTCHEPGHKGFSELHDAVVNVLEESVMREAPHSEQC